MFDGKANTDWMMSLIADSTYPLVRSPLLSFAWISAAVLLTGICLHVSN
jgi:hypothetical protein